MNVLPSAVMSWPHTGVALNTETPKSPCSARQPQQVLHVKRFVEAEGRLHLGDDLGGGFRRHEQIDRIAWDDVDQPEHDEGDAEQDWDGLEDAGGRRRRTFVAAPVTGRRMLQRSNCS